MCRKQKTPLEFEKYIETIRRMAAEEGYDTLDEVYVDHLRCRFFDREVIIGEGRRITLREMKMSDLEAFYGFTDALSEPVLKSFLKGSRKESEAYLKAYITQMYPLYDYGMWSVVEKQTGAIIGICGLGNPQAEGAECTDLGYYICPECRNQGLASECIEIVLNYAKNYLEIPVVCAIIKEENRISRGILHKFGFELIKQTENSGEKISIYQKEFGNE